MQPKNHDRDEQRVAKMHRRDGRVLVKKFRKVAFIEVDVADFKHRVHETELREHPWRGARKADEKEDRDDVGDQKTVADEAVMFLFFEKKPDKKDDRRRDMELDIELIERFYERCVAQKQLLERDFRKNTCRFFELHDPVGVREGRRFVANGEVARVFVTKQKGDKKQQLPKTRAGLERRNELLKGAGAGFLAFAGRLPGVKNHDKQERNEAGQIHERAFFFRLAKVAEMPKSVFFMKFS